MFTLPAFLKMSVLPTQAAANLGATAEGWRIGRSSHDMHVLDKDIRQGTNGYKTDQIINHFLSIKLVGSLLYAFKAIAHFGVNNIWLRLLKLSVFFTVPLAIPLIITIALALKRNEKNSILETLENYDLYNKKIKPKVDRLSNMWLMRKLHQLFTSEIMQATFKWLENNLTMLTKLAILALLYPLFLSGQVVLVTVVVSAITLSLLSEAKLLPRWLTAVLEKITHPIGLLAGLLVADPLTRVTSFLELSIMIIEPYNRYAQKHGVTLSAQEKLDEFIEEAFSSKNPKIKSMKDLFSEENCLDLEDNLRHFKTFTFENADRLQINLETLSKNNSEALSTDPELLKQYETIKFDDLLSFYENVGMFNDPTFARLLLAGHLTPRQDGKIPSSRFSMAVNNRDEWYNTSLLSSLSSRASNSCPIVKELRTFEDKIWTTSQEDQIAFARFSLLSMIYKLKYDHFSSIASKGIDETKDWTKAIFIQWNKHFEALKAQGLEHDIDATSHLRESMKEFALKGEYCSAGNLEVIESLKDDWCIVGDNATNMSIEKALPASVMISFKDRVRTGLTLAVKMDPITSALFDPSDQHSANRLNEALSPMGLSTHSSKNDMGLKHGSEASIKLARVVMEYIFNRLANNGSNELTSPLFENILPESLSGNNYEPGTKKCNSKLVEYWYLEQMGIINKDSPDHPSRHTAGEENYIDPWSTFYERITEKTEGDAFDAASEKFMGMSSFIKNNVTFNPDAKEDPNNFVRDIYYTDSNGSVHSYERRDHLDYVNYVSESERNAYRPARISNKEDFIAVILPLILQNELFVRLSSSDEFKRQKEENAKREAQEKEDDYQNEEVDRVYDEKTYSYKIVTRWDQRSALSKFWHYAKIVGKFCGRHTLGLIGFGGYLLISGIKATPSTLWKGIKKVPSLILGIPYFIKSLIMGTLELIAAIGELLFLTAKNIMLTPFRLMAWVIKPPVASKSYNNEPDRAKGSDDFASTKSFSPLQQSPSHATAMTATIDPVSLRQALR